MFESIATAAAAAATIAVLVAVARVGGRCTEKFGQPGVIGEIGVGILLGPSIVGKIWPGAWERAFDGVTVGWIERLSSAALILFLFEAGRAIDPQLLRAVGRKALIISNAAFLLPAGLGAAIAAWMHEEYSPSADRLPFILFVAAAMSVTALPVLIRILEAAGQQGTSLGVLAVGCALVDDVTAWSLFACVSALVTASGGWDVAGTIGASAALAVTLLFVVRPAVARMSRPPDWVLLALAFGSAAITDALGTHLAFGAFLAGLTVPRSMGVAPSIWARLAPLVLPIVFVRAGLATRFDLLGTAHEWVLVILITAAACLGKVGAGTIAAHWTGEPWSRAASLGVLLNARGVTELVLLTAGLHLGVITDVVYSMFVVMALVTTAVTMPLLRRTLRVELGAASRSVVRSHSTPPRTSLRLRPGTICDSNGVDRRPARRDGKEPQI